jgi:hypothetical protein
MNEIELIKSEYQNINKNKVSKMKCSICKKEGHNKRSCKKTTTLVSVPKLSAETDITVIPLVKVEQEMISESAHEHVYSYYSTTERKGG